MPGKQRWFCFPHLHAPKKDVEMLNVLTCTWTYAQRGMHVSLRVLPPPGTLIWGCESIAHPRPFWGTTSNTSPPVLRHPEGSFRTLPQLQRGSDLRLGCACDLLKVCLRAATRQSHVPAVLLCHRPRALAVTGSGGGRKRLPRRLQCEHRSRCWSRCGCKCRCRCRW